MRQGLSSWRDALSAVKGVHVITDNNTGKLYVGSASGDGGIGARWSDYAKTGEIELLRRESHWKDVLHSKDHGYNVN